MKLYAPGYYKRFACIASKCRHSCCVGWEIDIDPETADTTPEVTEPPETTTEKTTAKENLRFFTKTLFMR